MPNISSLTPDASKPVSVLPHFSVDRKSHTSSLRFGWSMQNFSFVAARHSRPVPLIGPRWPDFCRNVSRSLPINSHPSNRSLCWRLRILKLRLVQVTPEQFRLATLKCAHRLWTHVS